MSGAAPAIAAAVCTYNRYDMLAEALGSLAAQRAPGVAFEILVVDNSPDPARSAEEAKRHAGIAGLRWIHEKRPGLSRARNVATANAKAPIVAFLDDDARADPGWIAALAAAFDALGPQAQVVGGRILPWWGAARPAWLHDALVPALTVVDLGPERRALRPGEWVAGANIAFRRDALLEPMAASPRTWAASAGGPACCPTTRPT
jgi:glucosyl-dolichyl phosphate glucuronosyltransferase